MKKFLAAAITIVLVVAMFSVNTMAQTVTWNGDEPAYAIETRAVDSDRITASGTKITSNAHSADFGGMYFKWDAKQRDDGYLKVTKSAFDTVSEFTLTAKESNKYWDWNISPVDNQPVYTDASGEYFVFYIPQLNKNINMVFLNGTDRIPCDHGKCTCCENGCTCIPKFETKLGEYTEAYAGSVLNHTPRTSGTTGNATLRSRPADALGAPSAMVGSNNNEGNFYSVNFGDVTYGFTNEANQTVDIYNNPNDYDISMTEVTWDGTWYLEGVEVHLINALLDDGTVVPELQAGMAFNRAALTIARDNAYVMQYASQNSYKVIKTTGEITIDQGGTLPTGSGYTVTMFNFPANVVKAQAVKLVDCTKIINSGYTYNQYNASNTDGYDLDAVRAWWTLPTTTITYTPCCACCTCANCSDKTVACTEDRDCCLTNVICHNWIWCGFKGCDCVCKKVTE